MVRLDLLQSQMDKLRKYQEDQILQVLIQLPIQQQLQVLIRLHKLMALLHLQFLIQLVLRLIHCQVL